mmetsp:Transcript_18309/g.37089  ORF Transcript_18309/g.37089 Transcript_18309/m.37089 type:complete len:233 (-) Transcript_18309:147-845(-)
MIIHRIGISRVVMQPRHVVGRREELKEKHRSISCCRLPSFVHVQTDTMPNGLTQPPRSSNFHLLKPSLPLHERIRAKFRIKIRVALSTQSSSKERVQSTTPKVTQRIHRSVRPPFLLHSPTHRVSPHPLHSFGLPPILPVYLLHTAGGDHLGGGGPLSAESTDLQLLCSRDFVILVFSRVNLRQLGETEESVLGHNVLPLWVEVRLEKSPQLGIRKPMLSGFYSHVQPGAPA